MLYISDIYNVVTQKHFKYIDPNIKPQELYCVELRDFITGEQRVLCRPSVVMEDKYRKNQIGVVTSSRIHVISRNFIDLLSYLDAEFIRDPASIPINAIMATDFNLKNSDCLWYNQVTQLSSGNRMIKYFDLFEFLVTIQNLHQDINLYRVGVKYILLMHNILLKITVEKDLTVPITKYMIRR